MILGNWRVGAILLGVAGLVSARAASDQVTPYDFVISAGRIAASRAGSSASISMIRISSPWACELFSSTGSR